MRLMRALAARQGPGLQRSGGRARCLTGLRVLTGILVVGGALGWSWPVSPDGTGTMTVSPLSVQAAQVTTLIFTYTTAPGQIVRDGEVTLAVPPGWTPPSLTPGPGFTSASCPLDCRQPATSTGPMTITISGVDLIPGQAFTISYGSAIPPGAAGTAVFGAEEMSSPDGLLTPLPNSPAVTVEASSSASPTPTPSASVSSSSTASAGATPSVTGTGGPGSGHATTTGTGTTTVSSGQAASSESPSPVLILLVLALLLAGGATVLLAVRLRRSGQAQRDGQAQRNGPQQVVTPDLRAVPHTGPPPEVTIHETGTEPTLTVRIEPHASAAVPAIEEVRT